jgi:virginiamycin B lyase
MRLATLLLAAVAAGPLPAQQPAVDEWPVPWERTRPRDPFVGPDGRVWFVGQTGDYIGVFDLATRQFRRYELESGTGPHNLIVDGQGMIWYAGNRNAHIGRLDPRDGSIRRYPMPDSSVRDPHTLVFDSRGDIWFTAQGGNAVGKLSVATGEVRLVSVLTPRARPYGIVMDRNDRPWIVLFGTNKLATVDPRTFELAEYPLPRAEARPRRLAITSDGAVWYCDYAGGFLGRFDPATRQVREWALPSGARSRPYAMLSDDRDRLWVVETGVQPNQFVGFDARSQEFVGVASIPSGGGAVRHMYYDQRTQAIWFGTDTNQLGRARIAPQQP